MHIFNEQEIERHLGVQLSLTSQSEKLIEVEVTNFPPTYKKKKKKKGIIKHFCLMSLLAMLTCRSTHTTLHINTSHKDT